MKKIIVLGTGLVGNAIARDLSKDDDLSVTVADISKDRIKWMKDLFGIDGIVEDLSNTEAVENLVGEFDLVVGAVPGFMGFQVLQSVITAGKNIVDISFFPEDAFLLDALAKEKKITAVVDCGVAPGLSNMVLGYATTIFDEIESFSCYVGGLPQKRSWPFEYKATFSPIDVIEEYTRPVRLREYGNTITKPALSDLELVDFEEVGTLEAFNTDGLRTLLQTIPVSTMREKTLRYPGHAEKIILLRDLGFFDDQPFDVNGVPIKPLDFTSRILLKQWKLEEGEKDLTIMRIVIGGMKDGKHTQLLFELYDRYDEEEKLLSMARTTGFTCSMTVRLMLDGKIINKGICPPEMVAQTPSNFNEVVRGLKERKISIRLTVQGRP